MSTEGAPPLPCADGVSNLVFTRWAPRRRVLGFPSLRRGVRTTLENGGRTLNEVETFPRHHEQRRASPCVPCETRTVKENLRIARPRRPPGGPVMSSAAPLNPGAG